MEVDDIREGELLAAASGIVLLLVMLLFDWYGVEHRGFLSGGHHGRGGNAFESFTFADLFLLFTAVFAIVTAALSANDPKPNTPVAFSALVTLLGFFAVIVVLIRIIDAPQGLEVKTGAWLGLLATVGIVAGGWRGMREQSAKPAQGKKRAGRGPGKPDDEPDAKRGRGDRGSATASSA